MERLKSALHLSITTVQQHITSADPYSPAALLADPVSAFGPGSAHGGNGGGGGGGSARGSYSGRGDGGGGDLVSKLQGIQEAREGVVPGAASDAGNVRSPQEGGESTLA